MLFPNGRTNREIDKRIAAGCMIFGDMGKYTGNVNLFVVVKLTVYMGVLWFTLM